MHYSHHNSISKFHFQQSLDKCRFKSAVIDTSLNKLILNSKLLLPLYYVNLNLGGQRPIVKETKKSIASFRVRPNMAMGTLLTLREGSNSFKNFMLQLKYSFLPSISRKEEGLSLNINYLGKGLCSASVGVDDLTSLYTFFLLPSAFFNFTDLGGCNIIIQGGFKQSKSKKMGAVSLHKFLFSYHSIPLKS